MELYAVKVTWKDVLAHRDWDRAMRDHSRDTAPPPPPRKEHTVHVAVRPGWAGDPVARASDLAVERVVGSRACWDEHQPVVESVELVGGVGIESDPADADSLATAS